MKTSIIAAAFAAALFGGAANASALTIDYFTVGPHDQDGNAIGWGAVNNEVQLHLGPHGLPVLNTPAYGCLSNCFTLTPFPRDVTAGGEITYWSPALNNGFHGTSDVVYTGTAIVSLPFNKPSNFFPPDGTGSNDSNGYQAAHLYGTLHSPVKQIISFAIGADDMAFAFLDNTKVCDLGGIHAMVTGTCVTPFEIGAGDHVLDVFFVDMNTVQSGLYFDILTTDVESNPDIPEPLTLALFGGGLLGASVLRRRK